MGGRYFILFSLVAAAIIGAAGYFGWQSTQTPVEPTSEVPPTVAASLCDIEQSVTAPGNLITTRQAVVEMPSSGRLAEILVRPGDSVAAGQVLAVMDEKEKFAAQVADAELELLKAQQALEGLYEEAPQRKAQAQLALAQAEDRLAEATKELRRMGAPRYGNDLVLENARVDYALAKDQYKDAMREYSYVDQRRQTNPERVAALKKALAAKQAMDATLARLNWYLLLPGQNEVAQAEAELALAETALEQAQLDWEEQQNGPDSLEIALAEGQVENARAQLQAAQEILERLELRAPFAGVVVEIEATAGQSLPAEAAVATVMDPNALEVEASIIEEDLPLIQPGQQAQVYFDAMPEIEGLGSVSRVIPNRLSGDRPLYPIYITLEEIPEQAAAGMTADVAVITAQAKNVVCLPRSVVRASSGNSTTLEVWANGQKELRKVTLGLRGDVNIEIVSGLEPGELVVSQ